MFKEIRKDKIKMQFKTKSDSFELKDIFECGQCFRWNKQENDSYTGVFRKLCAKCGKKW